MRKIALLVVIGLVGFVWSALAQENDEFDAAILAEDDVYSYTAPLAGQITFRSPLRNADGSDNFAPVTSKNGQPRTTGSNPHIGVDLQPKAGESKDVYPVRHLFAYAKYRCSQRSECCDRHQSWRGLKPQSYTNTSPSPL